MTYGNPTQNQQQFARQYLDQQIQNATPAQQIVMMYDGAIRFLKKSQAAIAEKNIQERCNNNQRALQIINYMTEILDIENGGDISMRLLRIYTYISGRIVEVDIQNDASIIDEIIPHLMQLRQSWVDIDKQHQGGNGVKAQARAEANAKKAADEKAAPAPKANTRQEEAQPMRRTALV